MLDQVLRRQACLVTHREHAAERKRAVAEEQVERNGAALADEGHAALAPPANQLIGPERRTIEKVDEAITVRSEEGQIGCTCEEIVGELPALLGRGLGETGCKAHEATGAAADQCGGDGRHLAIRCRDEGSIRCRGQLIDRVEIALRGRRDARRVDAPYLARIAEHPARGLCCIRPGTADQRQAPGREQTLQVARAHACGGGRSSMRREPGPSAASPALAACSSASAVCTAGGKGAVLTASATRCTCSSMTSAVAATPGFALRVISNAAWMRL